MKFREIKTFGNKNTSKNVLKTKNSGKTQMIWKNQIFLENKIEIVVLKTNGKIVAIFPNYDSCLLLSSTFFGFLRFFPFFLFFLFMFEL